MPKLDNCHPQIVHALEGDGWRVEGKPARVRTPGRTIYIDVIVSRQSNGQREQILLAEIKCFSDAQSRTTDLYIAVGQYILYQAVLDQIQDRTPLYLAIPDTIYHDIFDASVRYAMHNHGIRLLIVDLAAERVVQWIE